MDAVQAGSMCLKAPKSITIGKAHIPAHETRGVIDTAGMKVAKGYCRPYAQVNNLRGNKDFSYEFSIPPEQTDQ
jgi:hypothetical protein